MSKVKDLAKRLGFSVNKLADMTGYTRQGLHLALDHMGDKSRRRLQASVKTIKREIEAEFQRDAKALQARYNARMNAAEDFLHAMMKEDAT